MMSDLPSSGGLSAFFSGDKDLGYLSNQLIPFGIGLRKYSIAVSGVDTLAISESASAAKVLSELYENIPSSGGLTAFLTGKNDISEFGNQLVPFGKSIKEYSFAVDGIKVDAIVSSTDAIQKLVSTIKSMTDLKIDGVKSFQNAVNILGKTNINVAGEDVINSFVKGINAKQSMVSSSISTIANNIVKTIGEKQQMFMSAGEQVINRFMAGINAKIYQLNSNISKMSSEANTTIRSYHDTFYQSGSYLVQGFANGISANSYKAAAKSKAMASAAITAAKKELDEHSPSKVFYKIGDFAGIGFINALSDSVKSSYNAGAEVARAAKNGITSSVNKIADAIDIGIDSTPTIRPVLDLSDVSSGVGTLNGMLSLRPSVGVLSNVGSISTMMNQRNQNGSNADVVSAIKDLKKTMDSGLTSEESIEFTVSWVDVEYAIDAEISVDENDFTARIRPYCKNDDGELVDNILLSVYRREFDGEFTEIVKDIENYQNVTITDPHPALDYARYRIVAMTKDTGAISFYDPPGYPVNGKSIIIQWDEEWSNFNYSDDDVPEIPPWNGSLLKLPYNIDVSDSYKTDAELVNYIGRKYPVSYYGTQRDSASTWNVDIEKDDEDTLYALRRLANPSSTIYTTPICDSSWEAVNEVDVGGTNLLVNTLNPVISPTDERIAIIGQTTDSGLTAYSTSSHEITEHGYKIIISKDGASYPYFRLGANPTATSGGSLNGLKAGQTYTISCDVMFKLYSLNTSGTTQKFGIHYFDDSEKTGTFKIKKYTHMNANDGVDYNTWSPISLTFTVGEKATMLCITIAPYANTNAYFSAGDYIAFRNLKLEKGNKATDWSPAPNDLKKDYDDKIADNINDLRNAIQTKLDLLDDAIEAVVKEDYYTKGDAEDFIESKISEVRQTANDLTIGFKDFKSDIDMANKKVDSLDAYFRFDSAGYLHIGKNDSNFELVLSNEKISFLDSGNEVAYIEKQKLYINDGEFLGKLIIGKYAFVPRDNGSLDFKKVR